MNPFYDTNLAAAMVLGAARHAVRLGIEGTITLCGETIPAPERGEDGEPIGSEPAAPGEEIELERSPAEWVAELEPYAESGGFERAPLLAGARWEVPAGPPGVYNAPERRAASGYAAIPFRRSVTRSRFLSEDESDELKKCRGSSGERDGGPWRAPYRYDLEGDRRADWEQLAFVQKLQDDMGGEAEALEADFLDWSGLLMDDLLAISDMKIVKREWTAALDGHKFTMRFDLWGMAWVATSGPMDPAHWDCLASLICGGWGDAIPEHDVSPTARDLLYEAVRQARRDLRRGPADLTPQIDLKRLAEAAEAARRVGAPASRHGLDYDRLALKGGYDVRQFAARCRRLGLIESSPEDAAPRWLIGGFIPLGMVTLVAGEGGVGKSTNLHELAVAVASEAPGATEWMGRPINAYARGEVIFATLEEGAAMFRQREAKLDPEGHAIARLTPDCCQSKEDLAGVLDRIRANAARGLAPRLLVIDSASKFRGGSENIDSDVNAFLDPLEQIARETGVAVIVVHHLKKRATRRRSDTSVRAAIDDLRERISGHPAFINRSRLVLGMIRDSRDSSLSHVIGLKENVMLPELEGMVITCRRDHASWRHIPVGDGEALALRGPSGTGERSNRPPFDPAADEAAALAALADLTATGQKVTKTGPKSLFSLKHQSVSGIPRARLDSAVESLLASGRVQNGPEGLVSSEEPASDRQDDAE